MKISIALLVLLAVAVLAVVMFAVTGGLGPIPWGNSIS